MRSSRESENENRGDCHASATSWDYSPPICPLRWTNLYRPLELPVPVQQLWALIHTGFAQRLITNCQPDLSAGFHSGPRKF